MARPSGGYGITRGGPERTSHRKLRASEASIPLPGGRATERPAVLALCHTGTVSFAPLPATACWEHRAARSGFEVAYFRAAPGGWRMDGTTAAVEDGQTWIVSYSIRLDAAWITREARVTARTASGPRETVLACDGGADGTSTAVRRRTWTAAWTSTWNRRR